MMATVVSTKPSAPSTKTLNVLISSPVPTLCIHTQQAMSAGTMGVPFQKMHAAEQDVFEHHIRRTSASSVATTPSTGAVAPAETASLGSCKETSEATIPLQAKVSKSLGRPAKEQKKSGHSHHAEIPTRPRQEIDSEADGDGNGKPDVGSRRESRNGNVTEKQ